MLDSMSFGGLAGWESAAVIVALAVLVRAVGHAISQVILAWQGIIMVRGIAPTANSAPSAPPREEAAKVEPARNSEPAVEPPAMHDHQEYLPLETRRAA